MNTKEKIRHKARELFNQKGFKNVTLREVAQALSISYGNVTYHYEKKGKLIIALYEDMLTETLEILSTIERGDLLEGILIAPRITFRLSVRYVFFYIDFVEIKRSYPELADRLETDNNGRKSQYLQILRLLQDSGALRGEFSDLQLSYLMDFSGALRTFFFMQYYRHESTYESLEMQYVSYMNNLLMPYLTPSGLDQYESIVG